MNFWDNLLNDTVKTERIEQNNISKTSSQEAVADMLTDDASTMPDDIPDDNGSQDQNSGDMSGGGDMSGDMGGDSSLDMDMGSEDDEEEIDNEPIKIKKNQYSDVNGKVRIMEQYNVLIDSAQKARDMFQLNEHLKFKYDQELTNLIELIEDAKENVPLSTMVENLMRYNLLYQRLEEILNNGISSTKLSTDTKK